MKSFRFNISLFAKLALPFAFTQLLGVWAAHKLLAFRSVLGIPEEPLAVSSSYFTSATIISLLIWIAITILFMVLAIKLKKTGAWLYRIVLSVVIISGVQAVLFPISPVLALYGALIALGLFWIAHNVALHNIIMVLTLAGIGALFGLSISPITAVLVLVVFSFYDIIAVYKTRHMVAMAKTMIQSHAIFGFVIPESLKFLKADLDTIKPGEHFMILGSGDVIFPLLLAASLVPISLAHAYVVTIFSVFGLLLMHLIFQNQSEREPMAALPPLAMMSIIGYVISVLF